MRHKNHAETDLLIAWLRDAYAMEKGQVNVLEAHAKDAARHPSLRTALELHARETERQAETLERCLNELGEEPSTLKNIVAKAAATVQATATALFKDEEVKNILTDIASENFEIGCYQALVEAARTLGRDDIADRCQEILAEEVAMARTLEEHVPMVTREAVDLELAEVRR